MLKSAVDVWELIAAYTVGIFSWGLAWSKVVKKSEIYDKYDGSQIYLTVHNYEKSISKLEAHCEKMDITITSVEKFLARLDERSKNKRASDG